MKKCLVLFVALLIALAFAAISEHKTIEPSNDIASIDLNK